MSAQHATKYARCPVCGAWVSVNPSGAFRLHEDKRRWETGWVGRCQGSARVVREDVKS